MTQIILYQAIAFPLLLLVGLIVFYFTYRNSNSTNCLSCSAVIPKRVHQLSLPCPECNALSQQVLETSPDCCCLCESVEACHRLWDGNSYCESCILSHAPVLMDYVDRSVLKEFLAASPFKTFLRASRFIIIFLFIFIGILSIPVLLPLINAGKWMEAFLGFSSVFLFFFPLVLVLIIAMTAFSQAGRYVSLWNGHLMYFNGIDFFSVPIRKCQWFEQKMTFNNSGITSLMFSGTGIIVKLPKDAGLKSDRITIGVTDSTREMWKAFLTLAAMPRKEKK